MSTYIILLRGVTPTGRNKVPMAELRASLDQAGLRDVRTYIQSGNVIARSGLSPPRIERLVHDVIRDRFGGDLVVLARSPAYFQQAIANIRYKNPDTAKLYFTFLAAPPEPSVLADFLAPGYAPDRIEFVEDLAYVLCASGYRDIKINNNFIERKLKISATTRVYNTVAKLLELSRS